MDLSPPSPGRITTPAPLPLPLGDRPEAPIVLSSDESVDTQVILVPPSALRWEGLGSTEEKHAPPGPRGHDSASPLLGISSPSPQGSGESGISDYSSGQDVAHCHGSDGKVPDSAVMTTRAGSILVMDYS
jgi:hypothetical protein